MTISECNVVPYPQALRWKLPNTTSPINKVTVFVTVMHMYILCNIGEAMQIKTVPAR